MEQEDIDKLVKSLSGEAIEIEDLFSRPAARKLLEVKVLLLVNHLPITRYEKLDYFQSFVDLLVKIEERIKHQKRGNQILKEVFRTTH